MHEVRPAYAEFAIMYACKKEEHALRSHGGLTKVRRWLRSVVRCESVSLPMKTVSAVRGARKRYLS